LVFRLFVREENQLELIEGFHPVLLSKMVRFVQFHWVLTKKIDHQWRFHLQQILWKRKRKETE